MGIESIFPVGTILKRITPKGDDLDEVRVVGGGRDLVVTSNSGFSGNVPLNAAVVRAEYGADFPDEVYLQRPSYVDPGPTPEQVFAAQDRNEGRVGDGLTRTERASKVGVSEKEAAAEGDPVVEALAEQPDLANLTVPESPRPGRRKRA